MARKIAEAARTSPAAYRLLAFDALNGVSAHARSAIFYDVKPGSSGGVFRVGTVFVKNSSFSANRMPVACSRANGGENTFAGVTVRDGETVDGTYGGRVALQSTGQAFVQIKGPAGRLDSVNIVPGQDYLAAGGSGDPVGKLLQDVLGSSVVIAEVEIGGTGETTSASRFYPFKIYQSPLRTIEGTYVQTGGDCTVVTDEDHNLAATESIVFNSTAFSGTYDVATVTGEKGFIFSSAGTSSGDCTITILSWRSFRVRAGNVGEETVSKTDGSIAGSTTHTDPDSVEVPAFDSNVDFSVESGKKYEVWIDCTDEDGYLDLSAPLIDWCELSDSKLPDEWGYLFVWVGSIDCSGSAVANKQAIVRQIRRSDVALTKGCIDDETVDIPI